MAFEERAAICEHEGGLTRSEADVLAALHTAPLPVTISEDARSVVIDAAARFLDRRKRKSAWDPRGNHDDGRDTIERALFGSERMRRHRLAATQGPPPFRNLPPRGRNRRPNSKRALGNGVEDGSSGCSRGTFNSLIERFGSPSRVALRVTMGHDVGDVDKQRRKPIAPPATCCRSLPKSASRAPRTSAQLPRLSTRAGSRRHGVGAGTQRA